LDHFRFYSPTIEYFPLLSLSLLHLVLFLFRVNNNLIMSLNMWGVVTSFLVYKIVISKCILVSQYIQNNYTWMKDKQTTSYVPRAILIFTGWQNQSFWNVLALGMCFVSYPLNESFVSNFREQTDWWKKHTMIKLTNKRRIQRPNRLTKTYSSFFWHFNMFRDYSNNDLRTKIGT
jgi:hypothetical protein